MASPYSTTIKVGSVEAAVALLRDQDEIGLIQTSRVVLRGIVGAGCLPTPRGISVQIHSPTQASRRYLYEYLVEFCGTPRATRELTDDQLFDSLPLQDLGLSRTVYQPLQRVGVMTLGQLIGYGSRRIVGTRSMGAGALAQIEAMLSCYGLNLRA